MTTRFQPVRIAVPSFYLLALIGLVAAAPRGFAQSDRYPFEIKRVQIGVPAGARSGQVDGSGGKMNLSKAGSWAPVWVWIDCKKDIDKDLFLVVETSDADETTTVATVPLPRMTAGESRTGYELGVIPYLKPGSYYGEIVANIRDSSGRDYAESHRKNFSGSPQSVITLLSLGSSLAGFQMEKPTGNNPYGDEADSFRNGMVDLGQCLDANQLPDSWIGYKNVDLAILTTGSDTNDFHFFTAFGKDKTRVSALREWVMRGGRLMVCVGSNPDVLSLIPEIRDILPATIAPTSKQAVDRMGILRNGRRIADDLEYPKGEPGKIFVTKLTPRPERPFSTIMEWSNSAGRQPLIVDGSYGAGRVLLCAIDLERAPMNSWKERVKFWEALLPAAGLGLPSIQDNINMHRYGNYGGSGDMEQFANRFQGALDYFEGVPVVSFGWVALFIFLYIILIGPVDYFVLKKVFRRLEWTWLTFPLIVFAVSAIAYYAAFAIKGRDMKINKIDLVQIDLGTKRVYGRSWFSVFSPRIQNYSIGIEPVQANGEGLSWSPISAKESTPNTVVSWVGNTQYRGSTLLRRSYNYVNLADPTDGRIHPAVGLQKVPIQVWSSKAFTAEWMVPLSESKPLIQAEFRRSAGDASTVIGTLRSNLPVEKIEDAHLIWEGNDYPLGPLVRGEERTITLSSKDQHPSADNWLKADSGQTNVNQQVAYQNDFNQATSATFRLWPFLFHDLMFGTAAPPRNAGYRELDQSWRVDRDHGGREAMIVGRIPVTEGNAEEWSDKAASPTRLWLNAIPGQGEERVPLQGTLRQETCIVISIPILEAKK